MAGAWVFPGGAVDTADGVAASADSRLARWRAAAMRELVEETGIWLLESGPMATNDRPSGTDVFSTVAALGDRFDDGVLVYFARWITPAPLPLRFDARFFAAAVPDDLDPVIDGNELVDAAWVRPCEVLDRAADGSWAVAFPTLKTIEVFDAYTSTSRLMDHLGEISPVGGIQPRLSVIGDGVEILIPGDPGFDAAGRVEHDPDLMARLLQVVAAGGAVPPDFRSV
jgi:8-oxo-dGTP pyrophosphatase MutT (NUDIX family)